MITKCDKCENIKSMITKCDKCDKAKRWKFNYEKINLSRTN